MPSRAALTTQLQEQINGLTGLERQDPGRHRRGDAAGRRPRIVTDYRVYVLTIPKARGVMVADIELGAADRLTKLADRLAAAIDQARGGHHRSPGRPGEMRGKLAAVAEVVPSLPAGLLALEPAGYPANHAVLEQARQSLRTGRSALSDAASLARRVIEDLK